MTEKIYLECTESGSSKFWSVSSSGVSMTIQYGKIGTNGQTSVKEFASEAAADAAAQKEVAGKLKKGYVDPTKAPKWKPNTGKWVLMSYQKFVETYQQEPMLYSGSFVDQDTVFLVADGDVYFGRDVHTDLNRNDFGSIDNPEQLPFFDSRGAIDPQGKVVVYVRGSMKVERNFIDDCPQMVSRLSFVVEKDVQAVNFMCSDGSFRIGGNLLVSDLFYSEGNDGTIVVDGTIKAWVHWDESHDVRCSSLEIEIEQGFLEMKEQGMLTPDAIRVAKKAIRDDDEDEEEIFEALDWYSSSCEAMWALIAAGREVFRKG